MGVELWHPRGARQPGALFTAVSLAVLPLRTGPTFSDASEREIPLCRLGGFSCRDLDLDLDSWVSQVR